MPLSLNLSCELSSRMALYMQLSVEGMVKFLHTGGGYAGKSLCFGPPLPPCHVLELDIPKVCVKSEWRCFVENLQVPLKRGQTFSGSS